MILELILPSLGYRELILEFIASTFVSMYDLLVLTDVPPRPPPPSDMAPPRPPPPETDDEEDFPIPQANQPIMVRVLYWAVCYQLVLLGLWCFFILMLIFINTYYTCSFWNCIFILSAYFSMSWTMTQFLESNMLLTFYRAFLTNTNINLSNKPWHHTFI